MEMGSFDKLQRVIPSYNGIKEELAFEYGVVLRNSKIVFPTGSTKQSCTARQLKCFFEKRYGF